MDKIKKRDNRDLVIKSNKLISANYNLSMNEQKMVLYAISKLDNKNLESNIVKFRISEFNEILGSNNTNYEQIKDLARNLRSKEIMIGTEDYEVIAGWFSSAVMGKKDGTISIEFSKQLLPYLIQLQEQFTRYELRNILSFKSGYSIRLYELAKQYEKIGRRNIKLEDLRKAIGIKEDEYKRFYDFERRVLEVAKNEINATSDINMEYEKIKGGKGNRITDILFLIDRKDKENDEYIEYLNVNYDIKEIQEKLGLEKENLNSEQIINLYTKAVENIKDDADPFKYARMNYGYCKANKKVNNIYAYLLKALEEDFANANSILKYM